MTQDRIIELAHEAGLISSYGGRETASDDLLQRFAALVRNATLEEAAGVCDDKHDEWRFGDGEEAASGPKDCAAAIRAMKDKT